MINISPTTFFVLTLLIGALNAVISGVTAYFIVRTSRKYDDVRHRRELLFKTAMENWKQRCEIAMHVNKTSNTSFVIYPFDDSLLHFAKLMEVAEGDLNPKTIEAKLKQVDDFADRVKVYRDKTEGLE